MCTSESNALGLWGGEDIIKRDFPIHRACRDGDLKALHEVWAIASYDLLTVEDKFYGWTPIHWAAYFGKIECLNALLGFGVSVNLCTSRFKQTPCHIASFGGHPQCLSTLLRSGANFDAQDYLGETPVHKAARVGNDECIGVLLVNGSRVHVCNNNGHTPCDLARMQNFMSCVEVLESAASSGKTNTGGIRNGSSGMLMGQLNGYHNGFMSEQYGMNNNGHSIKFSNKRMFEDESIPNFKRGKFENGIPNGNHIPVSVGSNVHDNTVEMDETMTLNGQQNECNPLATDNLGEYNRAPSPGMDLNLHSDDEMQLWCHENGYGDTAEMMPAMSNTSCLKHRQAIRHDASYDRALCSYIRGTQSRGWHKF